MAKGTNKQLSNISTRQIVQTRLYDETNLDAKYEVLDKLGEGSFGTVYRVKNRETNEFYAMKTIPKKPGNKSKASILDNEVKLLTEVNHPNLIQLHEVLESSQNLYLIVELCEGGELGGYIQKYGCLPEQTVKQIMSKLINALHYLHKMDIVHRDLKLENILLRNNPKSKTDEFDIRVTDFGLSSKKSITCMDSLFNDYCGTPLYMAPEILENKNYSALCDVWAMGIIMYYLISGRYPYVANDERRLLEVIRSQKLRFDSEKFRNLSSEGLDFLKGMIVYDTVHRRSMGELMGHRWLTGRSDQEPVKDIITMMREFQAENNRNQIIEEEKRSSIEIERIETMNQNKQQDFSENETNHSKINVILSDSRTIMDKTKANIKPSGRLTSNTLSSSRRAAAVHDTYSSLSNVHIRVKPNDKISDSTNTNELRQRSNSPAPSTAVTRALSSIRRGRSQSHADLRLGSKLSTVRQQQYQRPSLNSLVDVSVSPLNGHQTSTTSSSSPPPPPPAVMMINKQYTNNQSSCLLPVINHQHNRKNISFYQKRHSNHT